jgi:hypothetical protein
VQQRKATTSDRHEAAGHAIERMVVAYEAGRDGFWLARWLAQEVLDTEIGWLASTRGTTVIGLKPESVIRFDGRQARRQHRRRNHNLIYGFMAKHRIDFIPSIRAAAQTPAIDPHAVTSYRQF